MRSSCCLCVSVYPLRINVWTPGPIFMKLGKYVMANEAMSTAYFINPFDQWYQHCSLSISSFLKVHRLRDIKRSLFWKSTDVSEEPPAVLATCFHAGFLSGLFFHPEDGGDIFPTKRRLTFNGPQSFISQKIELFIATAVRTSDRTK
jgi:hypothetical protein